MEKILIYSIILLFVILLFLNIYFRVKVINALKTLREKNIPFDSEMVYNQERLQHLLSNRPIEDQKAIQEFAGYMRRSMTLAILLIVLITLFGGVLMYFRKNG